MANPIYINDKLIIADDEIERGYKLLDSSKNFAFVQCLNENIVKAVPTTGELKAFNVRFEALDILKFRQGVIKVGEPWQYLLIYNGLQSVSVGEPAKHISFEKMIEVSWENILPEIVDMLEQIKPTLLKK